MRSIPSGQLERWYGAEYLNMVSRAMCNPAAKWYGPPIPVTNAPGRVFASGDGDFVGKIHGGRFACLADLMAERSERVWKRWYRHQFGQFNTGFAGVADLFTQARAHGLTLQTFKSRISPGSGAAQDMWREATTPVAGAASGNAPGGTAFSKTSTGAIFFPNPVSGDTLHIVSTQLKTTTSNQGGQDALLLYDRLHGTNKTMNSTGTEAVTGVPTRYQSTVQGGADSAEGNFLFIFNPTTVLAATAHNWTTCLYTDQSGNASATLPSVTGISACAVHRMDHPVNQWFCPLAAGDNGIQQLDQMQCSAAVATGTIEFIIGHPLAWLTNTQGSINPAAAHTILDQILGQFSLGRIFDDACLALLDPCGIAGNNAVQAEIVVVPG
jgi:hypothetical protein